MSIKRLIIIAIIFHSFIPIAAGHGIGVVGLLDFVALTQIPGLFLDSIDFTIIDDFGKSWAASILFSVLGKAFLLIALFLKNNSIQKLLIIPGLSFLLISLLLLFVEFWSQEFVFNLMFFSSFPFLLTMIYILIQYIKLKKTNKDNID